MDNGAPVEGGVCIEKDRSSASKNARIGPEMLREEGGLDLGLHLVEASTLLLKLLL